MTPLAIGFLAGLSVLVLSGAVLIVRGARQRLDDAEDAELRRLHIRAVLHDIDAA